MFNVLNAATTPQRIAASLVLTTMSMSAHAQCSAEWLASGAIPGTNLGPLRALTLWDSDGAGPLAPRLVVGGNFSSAGGVAANKIALYDPPSQTWTALSSGFNQPPYCFASLPNGELVAGGQFTNAGGVPVTYISKWNGTTWSPVGGAFNGFCVFDLHVAANGDLIAGGNFTTIGALSANRVARWNGSTWSALGTGLGGDVFAVTELPNGDIVAGGAFTTAGGSPASRIARWNGSTWSAMGSGTNFQVYALTAKTNGDLFACGLFTVAGGIPANFVAKWNATSGWSALGAGVGSDSFALQLLPNGDLLIGGFFNNAGTVTANSVARWNGTTWSAMGPGVTGSVRALAVMPNGEIEAAGDFILAGAVAVNRFARYIPPTPTLANHPADRGTCPGGTVAFTVTPAGNGPFTYQWQAMDSANQWVNVSNGSLIGPGGATVGTAANATTATVQVTLHEDYQGPENGFRSWRCVVTTECGSVTSDDASVGVCLANFNCDDSLDFFDYLDFVDAFSSQLPSADFNSDGVLDFFDYLDFVDAFSIGC